MTERGGGSMLDELSNSLDYIEENLQEDITIEEIAKAAYTSKFHYQRMFFMLTGSKYFLQAGIFMPLITGQKFGFPL
ncbi:hypothetical protein MOC03_18580 [Bacillus atrophaeus]|uniref:hypothetical protein n=4 Tax=Bacillus atrophaeus TaxID=1452 RepID=UPI0022824BD5|nr:hypothetical protein [Bacillus atrophaeus]MCY7948268.1 hypothetical protein [Bacillus atrophaeus]MEC0914257.1 hypothetical protein [Bacillus atrophaeus]